jgi:hypothetical protein
MDMDSSLSQHKDFSAVKIKKKIHRISEKSLIVIDEDLARQLFIDEDSWCEQEPVPDGILLKLFRYEHHEWQLKHSMGGGKED